VYDLNGKPASKKGGIETIADIILFFFVTIPLIGVLITLPFCSGWNESTGNGKCTLHLLENFYNGIMSLFLIIALAGPIFVIGPIVLGVVIIVLGAVIVSVSAKISRFAQGYRPRTVSAIALDFVLVIPVAAVVYFCLSIFIR
jgi:hypothetical protein